MKIELSVKRAAKNGWYYCKWRYHITLNGIILQSEKLFEKEKTALQAGKKVFEFLKQNIISKNGDK